MKRVIRRKIFIRDKKARSPFSESVIEDVHGKKVSIKKIRRDILRQLSKINKFQIIRYSHIFNRKPM